MDESVESNVVDDAERLIRETVVDARMTIGRVEAILDNLVATEAAEARQLAGHLSDSLAALNRAWLVVSEGHSAPTPPPRDEDGGGDDILSQFETRHYNNGDTDDGEETDKCSICLERLHRGLVATLHCRHEFHGGCIGRWLRRGHNSCPLCKARAIY